MGNAIREVNDWEDKEMEAGERTERCEREAAKKGIG